MTSTSHEVFVRHFSEEALREIIDNHLKDGVARGIDGTNYDGFLKTRDAEVKLISKRALTGTYRFTPYREKLILKDATTPPRRVSIPTLRDRVTLRALNNFLAEIFHDCKPQHSHPIISSVLHSVSTMREDECFIKLDIKSFYDDVSHEILMKNLKRRIRSFAPIKLLYTALRTPTGVTVASETENTRGIPQGLSISNILSSIYLSSIDERYSSILGVRYHRYVDDILCIAPVNEAHFVATDMIKKLKRDKKLTCHPLQTEETNKGGKSRICKPDSSILYLGYSINTKKISVRPASEKKLMSSIMEIIFGATDESLARAIWRINLRITGCRFFDGNVGWIFYFSQINDVSLLAKMDTQVRAAVIRKFGASYVDRIKKLVTAFHQVKYNQINSKYFPNFDTYTRDEKIAYLNDLAPGKYVNLEDKSDEQISRIFGSSIWREVKRMERDTLGSFS